MRTDFFDMSPGTILDTVSLDDFALIYTLSVAVKCVTLHCNNANSAHM